MAIKFGDTLENQNSNYPIVDATGNNAKGIIYVADWTNGNLNGIPAAKRATGTIGVATDDGRVYVYTNASTLNGTNLWDDADGTAWVEVSGLADNTLGQDAAFDNSTLQDNSPAIATFTTGTTVTSAIDQLNETLGALVPTAPAAWSSVYSSLSWDNVGTKSARLVEFQSNGSTLVSHATNGNAGLTTTGGTTVNWHSSSAFSQEWTSVSNADWDENDLARTQFQANLNDEQVELESSTDDTQTLSAANNDYGGDFRITVTTGNFPTSGDSAGFYTGVRTIDVDLAATLSDGYHVISFGDDTNLVSKTIYREADLASASTSNRSLARATYGNQVQYLSGIPHFINPTWTIEFDASNIVPANALVYGAHNSSNINQWALFGAGSVIQGGAAQEYDDISGISDNSSLKQNLSVTDYQVSANSGNQKRGAFILGSGSNTPSITIRSIHGNSSTDRAYTSDSNPYLFASFPSNSSSEMHLKEDDLYHELNGSGATDGVRVADPDAGGTYVDTPADANTAFSAWSPQYGNAASSAADIDPQDAITVANSNSNGDIRLKWSNDDYQTGNFNVAADVSGSAFNDIDFSGRNSDAQYVTYKFPINSSTGAGQQMYLKFQGQLQATGELYVKIFDSGDPNSIVDNNSGTNGWLKATAASSGTVGGVPTVGCATGGALSKTSTALQTITLDCGQQRWRNADDNHVYVRIKLLSGGYVRKLGLFKSV